jgi:hypothetical protein
MRATNPLYVAGILIASEQNGRHGNHIFETNFGVEQLTGRLFHANRCGINGD